MKALLNQITIMQEKKSKSDLKITIRFVRGRHRASHMGVNWLGLKAWGVNTGAAASNI